MKYKEKIRILKRIFIAECFGAIAFVGIWFIFLVTPDYWYKFSSDQYLMLFGYAGGMASLGARDIIVKFITRRIK